MRKRGDPWAMIDGETFGLWAEGVQLSELRVVRQ